MQYVNSIYTSMVQHNHIHTYINYVFGQDYFSPIHALEFYILVLKPAHTVQCLRTDTVSVAVGLRGTGRPTYATAERPG
jgi:hypothetical protein